MPYIDASDGVELYCEDFGDGPALLFVHGGGATHAMWDQQVFALADDFRTICLDLRGVGRSGKPRVGYGLDRFADDLADVVRELDLRDVTVIGHGVGNHIILRCAHRSPAFASRIMLCAAAPWYAGDREQAGQEQGGFSVEFADLLRKAIATDHAELQWEIIQHWLFKEPPQLATVTANLQMAMAWPTYVWKMLERDLIELDHRPYLSDVKQPVLIAHGVHDKKNRYGGASLLATYLPHGKVVSFEDSAHCPMAEQVDDFNRALREFAVPTGDETAAAFAD